MGALRSWLEAFLRFLWTLGRSPLVVGSSGTWSTALVAALGSVSFREEPHWLLGSPEGSWWRLEAFLRFLWTLGRSPLVVGSSGTWSKALVAALGQTQTDTDRHRQTQTRPDQTRPDQTRPDQTRPDQTRHRQTQTDTDRHRQTQTDRLR